ncbi:Flp pilus assembly CpaF family ATPase [Mesorhizobium sangaii]|uniref:Flp pilus assembly CpaF family ATPase n=1 Tax=Mesorhizobium sangaii TaxID=505389 RepID=A0A841PF97_9HYPH|nr:Flp pilus assembly CpaF family ATPase [Mesorhizobium sangaii]
MARSHALGTEVNRNRPIISGELPIGGHRFEGLLSPVVAAPVFTIRKRATQLFQLDSYVPDKIMTEYQASVIRNAVENRMNIIVSAARRRAKPR